MKKLTYFWRSLTAAAIFVAALGMLPKSALAQPFYTVNGVVASIEEATILSMYGLMPGHYWVDAYGNWGMVGDPLPRGNESYSGSINYWVGDWRTGSGVFAPSGERGSNGFSIYSPHSGSSVGGDNNGCYYVGDWSNC